MTEKYGEAISIAKSESEKKFIYEHYICGEPEEIVSKLAVEPVLRSAILSLISAGFVRTEAELLEFFESTFYGHQYKDDFGLMVKISDVVKLLALYEFILVVGKKLEPTRLGKRVSELYLDPNSAFHMIRHFKKATSGGEVFSYLNLISNTVEMRPLLRLRKGDGDWIQEELAEKEDIIFERIPKEWEVEFGEFINSFKTALLLEDWISEKSEEFILDKYDLRPGGVHVKIANAKWLLYSASELARLLELREVQNKVRETLVRVQHGIRTELLALVKLRGIGRWRARKLFSKGFKTIKDLKAADVSELAQLIGSKNAINVKEQLGQKVKNIRTVKKIIEKKEMVKKGQVDLTAWS